MLLGLGLVLVLWMVVPLLQHLGHKPLVLPWLLCALLMASQTQHSEAHMLPVSPLWYTHACSGDCCVLRSRCPNKTHASLNRRHAWDCRGCCQMLDTKPRTMYFAACAPTALHTSSRPVFPRAPVRPCLPCQSLSPQPTELSTGCNCTTGAHKLLGLSLLALALLAPC